MMSGIRLYQTALGIETADIVTTSYGTGPYDVVSIAPLRYVHKWVGALHICNSPHLSLVVIKFGEPDWDNPHRWGWLNEIRAMPDGRYLEFTGDELRVEKPAFRSEMQIDMFNSYLQPVDSPYVFQDGVDYSAGDGNVWKCGGCKRDFNGTRGNTTSRWHPPTCPYCQRSMAQYALLIDDIPGVSTYLRTINT